MRRHKQILLCVRIRTKTNIVVLHCLLKSMTSMPLSIRYQFTQSFLAPAKKAFEWCTDFCQSDYVLMGEESAERQIIHLGENTIILKDVFYSAKGSIEKEKLVALYPEQLFWISTHLTGPNKHSQFLYQILPNGKSASILNFTALHLEYAEETNAKLLAEQLCGEDTQAWKLLAKAMANELGM